MRALLLHLGILTRLYSVSKRSVPCKFEDYLEIDFHDWMAIRILFCHLLPFDRILLPWGGAYEGLQQELLAMETTVN